MVFIAFIFRARTYGKNCAYHGGVCAYAQPMISWHTLDRKLRKTIPNYCQNSTYSALAVRCCAIFGWEEYGSCDVLCCSAVNGSSSIHMEYNWHFFFIGGRCLIRKSNFKFMPRKWNSHWHRSFGTQRARSTLESFRFCTRFVWRNVSGRNSLHSKAKCCLFSSFIRLNDDFLRLNSQHRFGLFTFLTYETNL